MTNKIKVLIYVDPVLFERLEAERGLIPRSTYVEDLIKKSVGLKSCSGDTV